MNGAQGIAESGWLRANGNAPDAGNVEGADLNKRGLAAVRRYRLAPRISPQSCLAVNGGAVPMPNQAETNRARLLAAAKLCRDAGIPLPHRPDLARAISCTPRQTERYLAILRDTGALRTRRGASCVHVEEVRP